MFQAPSADAERQPAKSSRFPGFLTGRFFIWAAAVAVIAIAIIRYIQAPSFWLDEAFIAVSVRNRSLSAVFAPLEYVQYFPRLYLAVIVMLRNLLGYQIWSLRLLPSLGYIIATLLWSRLL